MGYSKSDTKYFPEIACSEQQILHFEQSPHIPYGENRRLAWDWEELHSFYEGLEIEKGSEVISIWKRLSANLEEMSFGTPGSNWLPARTNWRESKEGKVTLEWWGGEMWGNLTIWFYMLRLFHLFIDILTTGSFHLLCKEDVRELGQGFERHSIKDSQSLWGQDLPGIKRLFLLAGDNLTKTLISSFPHFGQPKYKGWKQGL